MLPKLGVLPETPRLVGTASLAHRAPRKPKHQGEVAGLHRDALSLGLEHEAACCKLV